MTPLLLVAAIMLLAFPGVAAPMGRRMPPGEWARIGRAAIVAGRVLLPVALALIALPTALDIAGLEHAAASCRHLDGGVHGAPFGVMAGLALVASEIGVARARRRHRRVQETVRVDPWLGVHADRGDHDLVVLPTADHVAYAVGGASPQVVLSQGLVDGLLDDEIAAVVGHEAAHVRHGHHRYLELAAVVDALLLGTSVGRRSATALRTAVERWADEVAASSVPRRAVRGALLKCSQRNVTFVASFSGEVPVLERLDALAGGPPERDWRSRVVIVAPIVAICAAVMPMLAIVVADHGLLGRLACW